MEKKNSTGRTKAPWFTQEEEMALLNIIERYKDIIIMDTKCNGRLQAEVTARRNKTWEIIAKEFNRNSWYKRSAPSLKTKWQQLKVTKMNLKLDNGATDAVQQKIFSLYGSYYSSVCKDNVTVSLDTDSGAMKGETAANVLHKLENFEMDHENQSSDEGRTSTSTKPSPARVKQKYVIRCRSRPFKNFTRTEIPLLLQCAKKEEQYIFSSKIEKEMAWDRIAQSYNQLSPHKKNAKSLRKKFMTMRTVVHNAIKTLIERNINKIDTNKETMTMKSEPESENESRVENSNIRTNNIDSDGATDENYYTIDVDDEYNDSIDVNNSNNDDIDVSDHNDDHDVFAQDCFESETNALDFNETVRTTQVINEDPLRTAESPTQDSGNGSSPPDLLDQVENAEIVKLKLELLKYQMETAKMERKRVEDLLRDDEIERRSRELERGLRLRAARLQVAAAASRLPNRNAALRFGLEETQTESYLNTDER